MYFYFVLSLCNEQKLLLPFCSLPIVKNVPKRVQILFFCIAKGIGLLILSKVAFGLGLLLMDELSQAVAPFLPSSSSAGGLNQPPAPSEDPSFFPITPHDHNQDQPGPSASEGEGRAVRDLSKEYNNIEELRKDKYLDGSYRNALIKQENIIIEIKKSVLSGNNISDEDIRQGVDIYLTEIMGMSTKSRNKKLSLILGDLTDRGSASPYFSSIVKEIESLNGPFF